jgi:Cd2+/Zn2+-exporting ATPase
VAINSATIALMSDDLGRLPFLMHLSRRARRIVSQNLLFGLFFIITALTLAGTGNLTAVWAAVLHNIGSFIVVFNSARLVRFGEHMQPHGSETA